MVTFGLPEDYFDTYRRKISSVTAEDVLAAAQKYVRPEELQVVVVGNPDLIRDGIENLAVGPLSVREASEE